MRDSEKPMVTKTTLLIGAAVIAASATASAQVPTVPESITAAPFTIRRPPADLEALTRLYNVSDWVGLQALAREIICVARRSASETVAADDRGDYESCGGGPTVGRTTAAPDGRSARP